MQVTETLVDGLKREFSVVIPATELDTRLVERLNTLKGEVNLKGFRPGKVPISHLRRLYGQQAMAEIIQNVLSEVARDTLSGRSERAAAPPDFRLPEDEAETREILKGAADLSYTMTYEVLPRIDLIDFKTVSLERPVVEVSDEEVDRELKRLADEARTFATKDGKAENGDRVTISYVGKIDGEAFPGGTSDNAAVTIGSGQFIPGFEDAMIGLGSGEEKSFNVTFPENYGNKALAGKEATFDVTVKSVAAAEPVAIDDALATRLGLASLDALRDTVRSQIKQRYDQAARQKLKRRLLDQLDVAHKIELPQQLVDQEFDLVWRQINNELTGSGRTFEDEGTTEEKARGEYREIAERRVRLGLVLAEIGSRAKIEVTDEELQRALAAYMREFPGREQAVLDYYRSNPEAVAGLREPIFEEKVVDYVLELAQVTDKPMSGEEVLKDDDE
jgi:trigger factor